MGTSKAEWEVLSQAVAVTLYLNKQQTDYKSLPICSPPRTRNYIHIFPVLHFWLNRAAEKL